MVPCVRESLFTGRDVATLAGWRPEAARGSTEVAGAGCCRPLEGAGPLAVCRATEAAALVPLPVTPFELARWSRGKVHDDCHVKVGKTLYSVPWRHIGETVDARATPATVAIYLRGCLIKTHVFKARGRPTDFSDYPPDKVAFLQKTPVWCRARAKEVGPGCTELIGELLGINVLHRLRAAQGILGLAGRHSPGRLEAGCRRAIEAGGPPHRTGKGILGAGGAGPPAPPPPGCPAPAVPPRAGGPRRRGGGPRARPPS